MSKKMIEVFQCPGCVTGHDTNCGAFKLGNYNECVAHVAGTHVIPGGRIALGLPKGFCKYGAARTPAENKPGELPVATMPIWLWPKGKKPEYDDLNVPVWALEQDGHLFVRCFSPRINFTRVDIIEGGKLSDAPRAIDVSAFLEEID